MAKWPKLWWFAFLKVLESSYIVFFGGIPSFPLTNRSPLVVFWINPAENTDSPKLMEFVSLNPKSLLVISIVPFMHLYLTIKYGR
jgi:hypothetical protein